MGMSFKPICAPLLCAVAACGQPELGPPNVVLISIDTLRADHLGCYGYERATSPTLDGWAARGVRFERAYAQANQTLPSHVALLSSLYPTQVEITRADGQNTNQGNTKLRLPETAETLAERLAAAGYATAAWTGGGLVAEHYGLAQGFQEFQAARTPETQGFRTSLPALTQWLQKRANHEQPFFAFVHSYDVHDPYHAPAPFERTFSQGSADDFVNGRGFLPTANDLRKHLSAPSALDLAEVIGLYDNGIAAADRSLHQLQTILEEFDEWDNTMIVVVSDHGEEFQEHGNWGHGPSLFDELLHVPLIVRFPGDAHAGEVVAGNVRLVDVAPTIAEWVDVPGGAEWAGESLLELIGAPRADRPVLAALSNAELGTVALIDGEWKWIEAQGARPDLLFNRLQDPDEQIDVRKQQVDLGIRLQKQLADWLADQKARSASVRAVPMDAEGKNLQEMEKELLNQMGYLGD
jgi:arylsulfatase A-like enzyme